MNLVRLASLLFFAVLLAACQSTQTAPVADAKPVTYGDWTVKTSGYVRVDTGVVH